MDSSLVFILGVLSTFATVSGQEWYKSFTVSSKDQLSLPAGVTRTTLLAHDQAQGVALELSGTADALKPDKVIIFAGYSCWAERFIVYSAMQRPKIVSGNPVFLLSSAQGKPQSKNVFGLRYAQGSYSTHFHRRVCQEYKKAESGNITAQAPNVNNDMPHLCLYQIIPDSRKPMVLTITDFMDPDGWSSLWVFEGIECTGKVLFHLTSKNWKPNDRQNTVFTNTGEMFIVFETETPAGGFRATYETIQH